MGMRLLNVAIVSMMIVCGCASNKLNIEVDLYNEDPQYVIPISPQKIASVRNSLTHVQVDTQQLAAHRISSSNSVGAA